MPKKQDTESHVYEIRKEGRVYMRWYDPALTYPKETLKSMKQAGYRLFIDGKMQR